VEIRLGDWRRENDLRLESISLAELPNWGISGLKLGGDASNSGLCRSCLGILRHFGPDHER
jgi:hypothetical protein